MLVGAGRALEHHLQVGAALLHEDPEVCPCNGTPSVSAGRGRRPPSTMVGMAARTLARRPAPPNTRQSRASPFR